MKEMPSEKLAQVPEKFVLIQEFHGVKHSSIRSYFKLLHDILDGDQIVQVNVIRALFGRRISRIQVDEKNSVWTEDRFVDLCKVFGKRGLSGAAWANYEKRLHEQRTSQL